METCCESLDEAKALYQQGLAALTGKGATKDVEAARRLFQRAAALDDSISMEVFGMICGRKVRQEEAVAMIAHWYRFAARRGCLLSMVRLGYVYEPTNPVMALACFLFANRHGYHSASIPANALSRVMNKRQKEEAGKLSFKWIASGHLPLEL